MSRILTNHKVTELKDGVLRAVNQDNQETVEIKSQMNLIAIGRTAVLQEELYDRLGLAYSRKGIEVDDMPAKPQFRASGQLAMPPEKSILAHCGIQQGVICAENIMRKSGTPRLMDYSIIPAVVYSLPEIFHHRFRAGGPHRCRCGQGAFQGKPAGEY